jgi:hypothetical protein
MEQGLAQLGAGGRAEKLRHLAEDDVEADAGEVAADDGIGHVLDQPAQADAAEQHLQRPGGEPDRRQQHHHHGGVEALLHAFDGERREHGRSGRTRVR